MSRPESGERSGLPRMLPPMRPLTVSCVIDAPRERVFDYLSDIANHAEVTDHFLKDFRLERLESRGVGAAARFRIESSLARLPLAAPLASMWAEVVITGLERPHRIALEGQAGRIGRIPLRAEFRLTPHDSGMTRVEYTFSGDPGSRADKIREALGARWWLRRQNARALRRLRSIMERQEPPEPTDRVAAGAHGAI
jgi:uncharacterized protein YndB with AHSA1/START domain